MIKKLFKLGSHAFLIFSILSALFRFGHHEEEEREEKKCFSIVKILAVLGSLAALGFLFEDRRKKKELEHHFF